MKKLNIVMAAALACASFSALADSTATNNTQAQSSAVGRADNAGNSQNIVFTSPDEQRSTQAIIQSGTVGQDVNYSGSYKIKNTPSVGGPNLTTSNDTCMGSTSASANCPGIGVSFGTTWTDDNCKMLKNSRELWNMGMRAASLALLCGDSKNAAALEMTGTKCPQSMTEAERRAAFSPAPVAQAQAPAQPVAQAPVIQQGATVTASAGAVVTRQADGSTFVDMRTGR